MDEFEKSSAAMDASVVETLRDELRVMRMLLTVALLMLISLSLGADYYLSRQTANMKATSAQLQTIVDAFPQAAANDFVARLKEYAKTHPDFSPIATKYAGVFSQSTMPGAPKK
jgi:hypothetical protein